MKEVTIKLTDEQRKQVKDATGKEINELKVGTVDDRANPLAFGAEESTRANPLSFAKDVTERANPLSLAQDVTERANPLSIAQDVTERANPLSIAQDVTERANPLSIAQDVTERANPFSVGENRDFSRQPDGNCYRGVNQNVHLSLDSYVKSRRSEAMLRTFFLISFGFAV